MFNQYIANCTTRIFNVLFNCQIDDKEKATLAIICSYSVHLASHAFSSKCNKYRSIKRET